MEKEQVIGPGKFVAFSYKVYNDANSELLFEAKDNAPDVMVYGVSNEVIPGLVKAIEGMKEGDRFSLTLPPQAAFGERSDDNIVDVPVEAFMRDGEMAEEVVAGAILPMMTDQGFTVTGRVVKIGDENVEMDFNHPFAGLTVRFEGEIKQVRPATEEEMNPPAHGCGGCGGGCNGGGCGDGSCGDGGCGGCK